MVVFSVSNVVRTKWLLSHTKKKWRYGIKLNIVVPMAGRGSRFSDKGYAMPKPLIDIYGHPMIEYVIKNITPKCEHRFIFIC